MRQPWHKIDPLKLARLKEEVARDYPDLRLSEWQECIFLEGSFPIIHDGYELDRFQVKIKLPSDFPETIPTVWETAGRIPRHPDWHTDSEGTLCIIVPEEWLLNPESSSLLAFLNGPMRNFLIGQIFAELGSPRPMGERSHSGNGLIEAYGEMVGSNDPKVITTYLDYLSGKVVKGHWKCPCGSGKELRSCHIAHMRELQRKIPRNIAKGALARLKKHPPQCKAAVA